MRWLCFLFASATAAQGRAVKPLRFDLGLLPVTRDSSTFFLDRKPLDPRSDTVMVEHDLQVKDSIGTLAFVAESPTAVQVPAGRFEVLPLRAGHFRLYVTRQDPRRVVKGETLDGRFSFELAHTAAVIATEP